MSGSKSSSVELPSNLVYYKTINLVKNGDPNTTNNSSGANKIYISKNSGFSSFTDIFSDIISYTIKSYDVTVTIKTGTQGSYYYTFNYKGNSEDFNDYDYSFSANTTWTHTFTIEPNVTSLNNIRVLQYTSVLYSGTYGIVSCSYTINNFQYIGLNS